MAEGSIPVDLLNPGQVFACLGFLEAADGLLGDAVAGFDWSREADVRFRLHADGNDDPFGVVLEFLAKAEIRRYAPAAYADPLQKKRSSDDEDDIASEDILDSSETFPGPDADRMALPIRLVGLVSERVCSLELSHWADASDRDDFKLYAGNRAAATVARAMLRGARAYPMKGRRIGDAKTRGVVALWNEASQDLQANPFDLVTPMGGSFNFDPRGAWTAIDVGYSPNDQKHVVAASPVVEILAAVGLEHARPRVEGRRVRYGAWGGLIPPVFARPALAGTSIGVPVRTFWFTFSGTKHNKVVTFAQEEIAL